MHLNYCYAFTILAFCKTKKRTVYKTVLREESMKKIYQKNNLLFFWCIYHTENLWTVCEEKMKILWRNTVQIASFRSLIFTLTQIPQKIKFRRWIHNSALTEDRNSEDKTSHQQLLKSQIGMFYLLGFVKFANSKLLIHLPNFISCIWSQN